MDDVNNYSNKTIQKPCRYGCGKNVTFDPNIVSKNGIPIPLESETRELHQCLNKIYKKEGQLQPNFKTAKEILEEEKTQKAKQVISETEYTNALQTLVHFGNSNLLKNFKLRLEMDKEHS
jgi:hypothetical protein